MKSKVKFLLIGAFAIASLPSTAIAKDYKTETVTVAADTVVDNLDHPWGLAFLPDGALLVTERSGTMRIVRNGKASKPIENVPDVAARGQGGLLDVALAPEFERSGRIYFTYSEPGRGGAGTALASARLVQTDGSAALEDVKVLVSMNRKTQKGQHFGSRIVIAPDGKLFVTMGERGEQKRAQDFKDHAGSVLRINADGSIPKDNPFADGGKGLPELWSKGHRNPQGAAWDPVTNSLLTLEHGAKGGDEINQPRAGRNYGWPVISYGEDYSGAKIGVGTEAEGYEQPLYYWDPSIAPSGLAVYQGKMFPEWNGDLLAGALKFELLVRLDRDEKGAMKGEERLFEGEFGRIRDVRVAPDGSIYLLTDDSNGKIVRLTRASGA
ncbi:PQQ-dependent sugar dehydrogenase [Phyllobacterium sp. 0TCS1.6C]|uniref:PQQ-dependent sugar dehydrogenase n=1 Tax=unclassified Phyllobacterium TaxID=2638441 RepID=UPI002264D1A8|nr:MULTISPECIES: PQQ-dependent sugar dehydrogenase [unclassified Phyllobacterium]MCX8282293.1 PQQ-dependent sugar dehydrogenase [Phyllobacterium sp. 0TCS1.6C]MCX8292081.1 PQQ-dependent sugar dehydrogenase [Phyllobacterium sp. 0TCS1.6A]